MATLCRRGFVSIMILTVLLVQGIFIYIVFFYGVQTESAVSVRTESALSLNDALKKYQHKSAVSLPHCSLLHSQKHRVQDYDPCASPLSLDRYLQEVKSSIFSKFNPVCPNSATNRVHVVIPFYNLKESVILEAVNSAASQQYPHNLLHIWLYDDGSSNPLDLDHICCGTENVYDISSISFIGDDDKTHVSRVLRNNKLESNNIPSLLCFRSKEHLGPGGGKFWLFRLVSALAGANDIVIVLDGDDILLPGAVQIINQKVIDDSSWFTYGSYEGMWSSMNQPIPSNIKNGEEEFTPRLDTWRYGHPRSFKAHLLDHLEWTDFTQLDGSWLTKASDRGFVYKMLELSGVDRISYIPEKIYKYKYDEKTSTLSSVSKASKEAQTSHTQDLTPSSRLELPIHIILLTWKRVSLLKHQLRWLGQQIDLNNRPIYVHIVNNNWEKTDSVNVIVDNFKRRIKHHHDDTASISHISVTHSDKNNLLHCFARFKYVDELRQSTPLDSVIFVDDDQYWEPTFISNLLKDHKPRGMTTWYGKIFEYKGDIADYWTSKLSYGEIIDGKYFNKYSTFKYGGPGGSIIDANLWTFRHQLMRLQSDLDKWAKMDDIWISYIIDALLGWEIRRLRPPTVPIDVSRFRGDKNFQADTMSKLKLITSQEGEEIMKVQAREDFIEVSTFSDRKVDKQGMFRDLQTRYRWDVYDQWARNRDDPHML